MLRRIARRRQRLKPAGNGNSVVPAGGIETEESLKLGGEHFTFAADCHFVFPFQTGSAGAQGAVQKPAQVSGLKFPSRAFFPAITFFQCPAIFPLCGTVSPPVY